MKKFLLGIALALVAGSSFAQDVKMKVEPASFTLKPGETQEITVSVVGAEQNAFEAMQIVLAFPTGIQLEMVNYDDIYDPDDPEWESYAEYFNVLFPSTAKAARGDWQVLHSFFSAPHDYYLKNEQEEDVFWRTSTKDEVNVVVMNQKSRKFPAKAVDEEPLFSFIIKATDRCFTGTETIEANYVTLTTPAKESVTLADDHKAAEMTYAIDHVIPANGYSTLVWPVALDFTNNTFTAGTGTLSGTFMVPNAVTKIAANEPVIIYGEPGTYSLSTTKDEVAKVTDNVLEGTVDAPLKVSGSNIFALAEKAEGIGFYRCKEGVEIPQYKAYYTGTASADSYLFEETTGIREAVSADNAGEAYTISGVKVNNTNKKGVYVVNGKKVVVK